jgi:hypothetical protein
VDLRHQIPKPLAWQQAFMSTFVVGFALFFFTAFQGMGAKVLQMAGNPAFVDINQATVVPTLMKTFLPPVMLGVVFMGAIAPFTPRRRPTSAPADPSCCATSTGATSRNRKPATPSRSGSTASWPPF